MINVVGISFRNNKQLYYFSPNGLNLNRNDNVIVETERGLEYGNVELPPFDINEKKVPKELKKVIRLATKKDSDNFKKNVQDEEKALKKCRELAKKLDLEMQIIDAAFTFDRNQLLFRFISDSRIDFRKLAKELANCYKTRIELHQLGVRDKAKEIGGCGLCGLNLCCTRFNYDFTSVSINMAKNQNISLNPNKINGVCGRLLCCLRYEDEMYKEYKKDLPKVGDIVELENGKGKVVSIDAINQKYVVDIKEVGQVEVKNGSN